MLRYDKDCSEVLLLVCGLFFLLIKLLENYFMKEITSPVILSKFDSKHILENHIFQLISYIKMNRFMF